MYKQLNTQLTATLFGRELRLGAVGRVAVGRAGANVVFTAFLLSAYASLFMAVDGGGLPRGGLLGLASVVVAVPTLVGAWRYRDDMKRLMPYLGLNVMTVLSTPLLIVIGLRFL